MIIEKHHSILVVDDESHIVELIVECLTGSGYGVITASNGIEAIEKYHSHNPDLVVSAIAMPELDGISLVKRLQADVPDVKVLLMTDSPNLTREALGHQVNELGVVCLLEQPLNILELLSTIHVLLIDNFMLCDAGLERGACRV